MDSLEKFYASHCTSPKRVRVKGDLGSAETKVPRGNISPIDGARTFIQTSPGATSLFKSIDSKDERTRDMAALLIASNGGNVSPDEYTSYVETLHQLYGSKEHQFSGVDPRIALIINRALHGVANIYPQLAFYCRTNYIKKEEAGNITRDWMLRRFAQQVSGQDSYKIDKPTYHRLPDGHPRSETYQITSQVFDVKEFPGTGIVIHGLGIKNKIFPGENYLYQRFRDSELPIPFAFKEGLDSYKDLLISGESDLKNTRFAFFNGFIIVYNPCYSHGLLIFNEHADKNRRERKLVYLLPGDHLTKVLNLPMSSDQMQDRHPFYPAGTFDENFGSEAMPLVTTKLLTGETTLPEKDIETTLFLFSQLDLCMEALGIYARGESFQNGKWRMDETCVPNEVLNWHAWSRANPILNEANFVRKSKSAPSVLAVDPIDDIIDERVLDLGFVRTSDLKLIDSESPDGFILSELQGFRPRYTPEGLSRVKGWTEALRDNHLSPFAYDRYWGDTMIAILQSRKESLSFAST